MTDLVRIFFIFSFAVVAFSQYLRTSASSTVNDLRSNSRSLDDKLRMACGNDDEKFHKLLNNKEYEDQRRILFSTSCEINHDAHWFYILYAYLSIIIMFASVEAFFHAIDSRDLVIWLYVNRNELIGGYCLIGLVLNVFVFIGGLKATKPRSRARKAHSEMDQIYRTMTYTI